jgi:hypothetical protein
MFKAILASFVLILVFLGLLVDVSCSPSSSAPEIYTANINTPLIYFHYPTNPPTTANSFATANGSRVTIYGFINNFDPNEFTSASWDFSSLVLGSASVISEPSKLSGAIVISKITPGNGVITLSNTNKTKPVDVSGWNLKVLSNDHPGETFIPQKSVIAPIGRLNVTFSPLDNSAMVILTDSNGRTVDKVPYFGNWAKAL